MVTAGPASAAIMAGSMDGTDGAGRAPGRAPIRATSSPASWATRVATMMPMIEPGSWGWIFGAPSMMAATISTRTMGQNMPARVAVPSAWTAETAAFVLGPGSVPKAAGTCCRKMMTAMPSVKPSITGQGMKLTARPSFSTPATSTMRPAIKVTTASEEKP